MDGGAAGSDTASYADAAAAVTVSLAHHGSAQNTIGAGIDTLTNFENLTGSGFNDTLTGDDGANIVSGLAGNDMLNGGAGNDTMAGGRRQRHGQLCRCHRDRDRQPRPSRLPPEHGPGRERHAKEFRPDRPATTAGPATATPISSVASPAMM